MPQAPFPDPGPGDAEPGDAEPGGYPPVGEDGPGPEQGPYITRLGLLLHERSPPAGALELPRPGRATADQATRIIALEQPR